jgi:hypothetical protein
MSAHGEALEAARFLVDTYSKRTRQREAEPHCLVVARAFLAGMAARDSAIEEAAAVAELVCKANFMQRGGLLVDELTARIRALSEGV